MEVEVEVVEVGVGVGNGEGVPRYHRQHVHVLIYILFNLYMQPCTSLPCKPPLPPFLQKFRKEIDIKPQLHLSKAPPLRSLNKREKLAQHGCD